MGSMKTLGGAWEREYQTTERTETRREKGGDLAVGGDCGCRGVGPADPVCCFEEIERSDSFDSFEAR